MHKPIQEGNYNPVDDLRALNAYLTRYLREDMFTTDVPKVDAIEPGIVVLEIPNIINGVKVLVSFADIDSE